MDVAATPRFKFMPKIIFPAVTSSAVTVCLILVMASLIHTNIKKPPEGNPTVTTNIFANIPPIKTYTKEPKPTRPPEVEEMPSSPTFEPQIIEPTLTNNNIIHKQITHNPVFNPNMSSGGLVQQVMVPPNYPARAVTKGIEGYVDIRFSVTASGTTTDIHIVRSEPAGTFDRSAIKAVKRWKYLPDAERTNPLPELTERIRFTLDQ